MHAPRRLPTLAVALLVAGQLAGCSVVRDALGGSDVASPPVATAPDVSSPSSAPDLADPPIDDGSGPAIDPCTSEEQRTIEAVIDGQLDAFVADDWAAALAFASPEFRERFNPTELGRMIEQTFPVVANQVAADHDACLISGTEARVLSTVTDDRGDTIELTYLLESQPDGSWLIGGAVPTEPIDDGGPLI